MCNERQMSRYRSEEDDQPLLTELAEKAKNQSIESAKYLYEAIDLIEAENKVHGLMMNLFTF